MSWITDPKVSERYFRRSVVTILRSFIPADQKYFPHSSPSDMRGTGDTEASFIPILLHDCRVANSHLGIHCLPKIQYLRCQIIPWLHRTPECIWTTSQYSDSITEVYMTGPPLFGSSPIAQSQKANAQNVDECLILL